MNKAVYAGSFDPWTNGHQETLEKARHLFQGEVTILIATNAEKKGFLSTRDRLEAIRSCTPTDQLIVCYGGLVAPYCARMGVEYLVRGLRPLGDFDKEYQLATVNTQLVSPHRKLETVFFTSSLPNISSSLVRELWSYRHEQVRSLVPEGVFWKLVEHEFLGQIYHSGLVNQELLHGLQQRKGYHGWKHLLHVYWELVQYSEVLYGKPQLPEWVVWAILYHDAVYNPGEQGNEQASKNLFMADARSLAFSKYEYPKKLVEQAILLSDHKEPLESVNFKEDEDDFWLAAFLDADMCILGQPAEVYDQYSFEVSLEYSNYPLPQYRAGRRQFLEGIRERIGALYLTQYFRYKYRTQSLVNVERELSALQKFGD